MTHFFVLFLQLFDLFLVLLMLISRIVLRSQQVYRSFTDVIALTFLHLHRQSSFNLSLQHGLLENSSVNFLHGKPVPQIPLHHPLRFSPHLDPVHNLIDEKEMTPFPLERLLDSDGRLFSKFEVVHDCAPSLSKAEPLLYLYHNRLFHTCVLHDSLFPPSSRSYLKHKGLNLGSRTLEHFIPPHGKLALHVTLDFGRRVVRLLSQEGVQASLCGVPHEHRRKSDRPF